MLSCPRFLGNLGFTAVTNLALAFRNCSSLKAIPSMATATCTTFGTMAANCTSITTFPALNLSGCNTGAPTGTVSSSPAVGFEGMVQGCTQLTTWPANILKAVKLSPDFKSAFLQTNLTTASKDIICSELDVGGMTSTVPGGFLTQLDIDGGQAPSANVTGTLVPSLQGKGWTVNVS